MQPAVREFHKLALLPGSDVLCRCLCRGSLARKCAKLESILEAGGNETAEPNGQTWLQYVAGCEAVNTVNPQIAPHRAAFSISCAAAAAAAVGQLGEEMSQP